MSLAPSEQRSVLNCVPYFSKEAVVFDVGSNKGEFADLLIDNVSEIHLFEPNEMLLTYTKVKYCDRANVIYNNKALWIKNSELPFYYFTNGNNGLSSLLDNPEWDYLPKKKKKVQTISLDSYCEDMGIEQIDFIKIDVEGAELDVLYGAKELFNKKRIKYIQIEYSPHYKIAKDASFKAVIEFANAYGYKVFSTDVEGLEMTVDNFVEDYRLENFIIKNMEITEDWNSEFKKNTQGLKFDFALEIGAFEGLTSTYICDNLLNEGGRLIAVDPLKEKYLTTDLSAEDKKMNKELTSMFKGQYGRFMRNTKGYPIELKRMTSREAFPDFRDFKFDFIYIDGDHRIDEVYNDGFECFKLLKVGGHLLFDDYEWRPETQEGINMALNDFGGRFQLISKGYQVLIKKIKE